MTCLVVMILIFILTGGFMSKYIPKVGDKGFSWLNEFSDCWVAGGQVVYATPKQIAYIDGFFDIKAVGTSHSFRPIPTKADVEREKLVELIDSAFLTEEEYHITATKMQKAGFTIPKKVKRSEVQGLLVDWTMHEPTIKAVTERLCTLLGDLVEDDARTNYKGSNRKAMHPSGRFSGGRCTNQL